MRANLLRHIVLFKFKDETSSVEMKKIQESFMDLSRKIHEIQDMEWGINISPENFHQGFTHCFILSFESKEDLAQYQINPDHLEFQKILIPAMEKVFVVDYWANPSRH